MCAASHKNKKRYLTFQVSNLKHQHCDLLSASYPTCTSLMPYAFCQVSKQQFHYCHTPHAMHQTTKVVFRYLVNLPGIQPATLPLPYLICQVVSNLQLHSCHIPSAMYQPTNIVFWLEHILLPQPQHFVQRAQMNPKDRLLSQDAWGMCTIFWNKIKPGPPSAFNTISTTSTYELHYLHLIQRVFISSYHYYTYSSFYYTLILYYNCHQLFLSIWLDI